MHTPHLYRHQIISTTVDSQIYNLVLVFKQKCNGQHRYYVHVGYLLILCYKFLITNSSSRKFTIEYRSFLLRMSLSKKVANTLNFIWQYCGQNNLNSLQRRYNGPDSVSNHQLHDCFLNRLFRRRSKKTSKLRVTGLCAGNSPHKWTVTRKMFPFGDVIMFCIKLDMTPDFWVGLLWENINIEQQFITSTAVTLHEIGDVVWSEICNIIFRQH